MGGEPTAAAGAGVRVAASRPHGTGGLTPSQEGPEHRSHHPILCRQGGVATHVPRDWMIKAVDRFAGVGSVGRTVGEVAVRHGHDRRAISLGIIGQGGAQGRPIRLRIQSFEERVVHLARPGRPPAPRWRRAGPRSGDQTEDGRSRFIGRLPRARGAGRAPGEERTQGPFKSLGLAQGELSDREGWVNGAVEDHGPDVGGKHLGVRRTEQCSV